MQLYGFADHTESLAVELFVTSTPSNIKTKKDCNRLRELLIAKKVPFLEIDLAMHLWRRAGMLKVSNGVDTLPQLHANGKFIGDLAEVQELEDFGELSDALKPEARLAGDEGQFPSNMVVQPKQNPSAYGTFPYALAPEAATPRALAASISAGAESKSRSSSDASHSQDSAQEASQDFEHHANHQEGIKPLLKGLVAQPDSRQSSMAESLAGSLRGSELGAGSLKGSKAPSLRQSRAESLEGSLQGSELEAESIKGSEAPSLKQSRAGSLEGSRGTSLRGGLAGSRQNSAEVGQQLREPDANKFSSLHESAAAQQPGPSCSTLPKSAPQEPHEMAQAPDMRRTGSLGQGSVQSGANSRAPSRRQSGFASRTTSRGSISAMCRGSDRDELPSALEAATLEEQPEDSELGQESSQRSGENGALDAKAEAPPETDAAVMDLAAELAHLRLNIIPQLQRELEEAAASPASGSDTSLAVDDLLREMAANRKARDQRKQDSDRPSRDRSQRSSNSGSADISEDR